MWYNSSSQNRNAVIAVLLLSYPCELGLITARGPCRAGEMPPAPAGHVRLLQPADTDRLEFAGWGPNTITLAIMRMLLTVRVIYCKTAEEYGGLPSVG